MGWKGPMTYRQFLVWQAWFEVSGTYVKASSADGSGEEPLANQSSFPEDAIAKAMSQPGAVRIVGTAEDAIKALMAGASRVEK